MGENNSTYTRVVPLLEHIAGKMGNLKENYDVNLTNLFHLIPKLKKVEFDFYDIEDIRYGNNEIALPPRKEMLLWILNEVFHQTPRVKKLNNPGVEPDSRSYPLRDKLIKGDRGVYEEAVKAINNMNEKGNSGESWFIFEGFTQPDIYIKTKTNIFIGEAKRTEAALTTSTTWLKERDQLIRHVDAVIDSDKTVYSFFIFEEATFKKYKFENFMGNYNNEEYIKRSCPYRNDNDINKIQNSYVGYTFWESIKKECTSVPFLGMKG